ncbi:MAG: hypothetical protein ACRYHQ_36670 [Janthinobacterium lividum]
MRQRWLLPPLAALVACQAPPATIPVRVTSTPAGAACTAERGGTRLGEVAATPGTLGIPAMEGTVTVTCSRTGYVTATEEWTPVHSPDSYLLQGGLVGVAIRATAAPPSKSDWHYPDEFHVELLRVGDPGQPLPLSGLRLR